mgnify:CR=1 FL=1
MKIIKLKPTREPKWWVGEIHRCQNYYLCQCIFQLEENDEPNRRCSSGNKQHTPREYVWSVKCPECGKEVDIRAEEI